MQLGRLAALAVAFELGGQEYPPTQRGLHQNVPDHGFRGAIGRGRVDQCASLLVQRTQHLGAGGAPLRARPNVEHDRGALGLGLVQLEPHAAPGVDQGAVEE